MNGLIVLFFLTPEIVISPESHNFGEIGWEKVEYRFTVTNTGDDTLKIEKTHTSCGCTRANIEKKLLLSGDTTNLIVTFDPRMHRNKGKIKRTVTVRSNDPNNPVTKVTIEANVVPQDTEISLKDLPDFAFRSRDILRAYQLVSKEPEFASLFSCYCGCWEASDHISLRDCFLRGKGYDDHASNCTICIGEINDIFKKREENWKIEDIRVFLEKKYKEFGEPPPESVE